MSPDRLRRISGRGLWWGAGAFIAHIAVRSFVTAGVDPALFARHPLWVPVNALGVLGAVTVLFALPGVFSRASRRGSPPHWIGVVLLASAWLFFGVFLSLYGLLILPWLAEAAPTLIAGSAPLPPGILLAFLVALAAWLGGAVLLGVPIVRGRAGPRWIGYVLLASAVWMVLGNLVLSPSGPSPNVAINLLSNLAPVLLLIALGRLGAAATSKVTRDAPSLGPTRGRASESMPVGNQHGTTPR